MPGRAVIVGAVGPGDKGAAQGFFQRGGGQRLRGLQQRLTDGQRHLRVVGHEGRVAGRLQRPIGAEPLLYLADAQELGFRAQRIAQGQPEKAAGGAVVCIGHRFLLPA